MQAWLFSAVGLLMLTGLVAAQTPSPAPGPPAEGEGQGGRIGQMAPPEIMRHEHSDRMRRHHQFQPRGASFHFKRGDSTIEIRCASNEPTSDCISAATALIDKIASMLHQPDD